MENQLEMSIEGAEAPVDTRLSYSSANLLRNCEQKYVYYKVDKVEKDDDSNVDNSHFNLGTSFHLINEIGLHKKPKNVMALLEKCVQEEGLREEDVGLLHAMLLQYWRLREGDDFETVACEYKIEDDKVIGYVDLIEKRPNGDWVLSDLKTAATFYKTKIPELPRDRQLCLYSSYYKEIAKEYNLDPEKFIGCRYLVTTKSKAKQKKTESYKDFVMRLVESKSVKSHDIFIKKELLDLWGAREEHLELYEKSMKLRRGEKPTRNYTYCMAYFRPCDYFSQCRGETYSEYLENNKILVRSIE